MEPHPDPTQFMNDREPGEVLYGFAGGEDPQVEILIRETSAAISALPEKPEIQIRAGILGFEEVFVVCILFRMEAQGPIYPTFWNYHNGAVAEGEENIFDCMADGSEELLLKFFGDHGNIDRLIVFQHPLQSFFRQAILRIRRASPWEPERFIGALAEVLEGHDPESLWDTLQN